MSIGKWKRKAPCNYVDDSVDEPEQWCVKKIRNPASNLFHDWFWYLLSTAKRKYCEQYCQGILLGRQSFQVFSSSIVRQYCHVVL